MKDKYLVLLVDDWNQDVEYMFLDHDAWDWVLAEGPCPSELCDALMKEYGNDFADFTEMLSVMEDDDNDVRAFNIAGMTDTIKTISALFEFIQQNNINIMDEATFSE